MFDKDEMFHTLRRVLEMVDTDHAQVMIDASRLELTRYANNHIHQNTAEEDRALYVRVMVGGCEAGGSTNQFDDESLERLARSVMSVARASPECEYRGGPLPESQRYPEVHSFEPTTAIWTPEARAEAVTCIVQQAASNDLTASGAYYNSVQQLAIANSAGLEACNARTAAGLSAIVRGESGSGYGDGYARDVRQINPMEVGETAVSKALLSTYPESVPPGEYEVVLEQNAVADLLGYLSFIGFSATTVQEGRSFMSGKIGQEVTSPLVTITEDPLAPDGLYSPFDFEGVARQRVELIEGGVARGPVYDTHTAAQAGRSSTGHAVHPAERHWFNGPLPCSLFMAHGDADMEDLIGSVRRGLLVTRFHYLSVVNPTKTVLTGMTRDGTFLIEDGVIRRPVRNLRFVENILEAFAGIEEISLERKLVVTEGRMAIVAPALRLRRFKFMGGSGQ